MKVGIIGYSGGGKTTVFQWLTGAKPDPAKVAREGQHGVARVPDARLDWLSAKFNPRKTTPVALDFLDTPGLMPTERRDNPRRLGILREGNGLVVVLNGHSESDLAGQLNRFRGELIFADLEIVTNRMSKLEDQLRKPRNQKQKDADQAELNLLQRIAAVLEQERSPTELGLGSEEEKTIRSFQMLTLKPELVLVNCGDDLIAKPLPDDLLRMAPTALKVSPKLEMELQDLAEDERQLFMQEMGLKGFVRDATLQAIYASMNQI